MTDVERAAPAVEVVLRPSRTLAIWIFLVHALALGALAATRLPDWAVAGLVAAVLVSAGVQFRRHATLRAANALRRVVWTRAGEWLLSDARARDYAAELLPGVFVSQWLVVLNFRSTDGQRHTVLLTGDNCATEALRRLRVRLNAER